MILTLTIAITYPAECTILTALNLCPPKLILRRTSRKDKVPTQPSVSGFEEASLAAVREGVVRGMHDANCGELFKGGNSCVLYSLLRQRLDYDTSWIQLMNGMIWQDLWHLIP